MENEKEINVIATNNAINLYGKVSSAVNLSRALAVAESYAPKDKVNNLLEVGGIHQIMLEVKIAEMSRSIGKQLGINLGRFNESTGEFAVTTLGGFLIPGQPIPLNNKEITPTGFEKINGIAGFISPAVNAMFRTKKRFNFENGDITWSAFIDALKEDGLVKILAEPNLIALSGQTASFLAGGEFPIPVPDDDGITIEYKKYGVGLSFTPSVTEKEKIGIKVHASVSELDFTTAVQFSGYVVPGVTTREASTTIELGDGQSFAIAGLLSESVKENVQKYPFLGDIPMLGILFKSTSFQKNETELVIIVTPRFVKPINAETQPVPTDFYTEPDDAEIFFNLKQPAGSSMDKSMGKGMEGTLDGPFGHASEIK